MFCNIPIDIPRIPHSCWDITSAEEGWDCWKYVLMIFVSIQMAINNECVISAHITLYEVPICYYHLPKTIMVDSISWEWTGYVLCNKCFITYISKLFSIKK